MFAVLFIALAIADTTEPAPAAKGQPPRLLIAGLKGDQLVSRRTVVQVVPITVTEKVIVNGMEVDRTVTKYVKELKTVEQTWELKKATITAGGKKLDLDALKKRLAKPAAVVLSADGKPIDAAFLKLFDKDAIVIVVPADKDKSR